MSQNLPTILERIVLHKRGEVDAARRRIPAERIAREAAECPRPLGFAAALRSAPDIAVIAEIKKASPSKGVFREDFDPVAIGRSYEAHGASAISCLTDEAFFQGSLDIFRAVRAAVQRPMLRKEFIIDAYQVHEARAAGADAILLIASILDDSALRRYREIAASLGMDSLVEVHSPEEARRAGESGATLIGINNRDLASANFHTDIRHTERVLPHVPAGAFLVSESGIRSREDVDYLRGLGVRAILVGEQFMRHPDPGEALGALVGR